MLRVTEEKERNFEKRGYMGKKVLGIMVILLFFTGCQNMGNESENLQQVEKQENGEERNSSISNDETETNVTPENDQELSNGEHIRFQLGSQAKIDAIVDMPDKKWNEFEKCVIEVDGFQGESVFNKILGKIPESGLETRKAVSYTHLDVYKRQVLQCLQCFLRDLMQTRHKRKPIAPSKSRLLRRRP